MSGIPFMGCDGRQFTILFSFPSSTFYVFCGKPTSGLSFWIVGQFVHSCWQNVLLCRSAFIISVCFSNERSLPPHLRAISFPFSYGLPEFRCRWTCLNQLICENLSFGIYHLVHYFAEYLIRNLLELRKRKRNPCIFRNISFIHLARNKWNISVLFDCFDWHRCPSA